MTNHYGDDTQNSKHRKILIGILTFILIYTASIFIPIVGGYTAYPVAVIKCGNLPVITNDFMASYTYSEPGMTTYSGPNWLSTHKNYVCSAKDAEAEGYRKAFF